MTLTVPMRPIESVDIRACYLCDSAGEIVYEGMRDALFGVPGSWNLVQCSRCRLVWLSPRPRLGDISRLYERYYTHSVPTVAQEGPKHSLGASVREAVLRRDYGYEIGSEPRTVRHCIGKGLAHLGPVQDFAASFVRWLEASKRGRLLDVGSGNGSFLAQMKNLGWEVKGVEPDAIAARAARARYDLDITCAPLEEADLPGSTFDVVTASHVIEHVHDPIRFLSVCRRVLRPGGSIVIITPNSRSLGSRWFRGSWRGWEIPRHLFVFSPTTLRSCAERAGLRVDSMRTTARSAREIWSNSRGIRSSQKTVAENHWQRIQATSFWLLEHVLTKAFQCGEELLLVAGRSR